MLSKIREYCVRFPWLVIAIVLIVTVGAVIQIKRNLYFEGDITKFLPGSLPAVKANDYSQKNFNYQERVLIGVEYPDGSVLEPAVLRTIEKIVLGLKDLKAEKTFNSKLSGKTENLVLPIGIDTDDINSIANLEDTILDEETGSVIAGSVIEKLKGTYGIHSENGKEEQLPETDADLAKIIPDLRNHVKADRIFIENVLSSDEHAANIQVPMIRKWDYKRRFTELELETALDPQKLKNRFLGNDSTFPFKIYGNSYDGVTIDDAYIERHSKVVGEKLKDYLRLQLKPVFQDYPELKKLLNEAPTPEMLKKVMQNTNDRDFFLNSDISGWEHFTNNLYQFTLDVIDPFSRENLEFKFYDVKDIYNLKINYGLITNLVNQYQLDGVNFHIAGQPVVISLISYMMQTDMKRMVPIALLVVFLVLLISFRNLPGLIIPLFTVVITVIWTLALMAISGIPLSISTTTMPIILLAVGTAYGIHLLNRYFAEIDSAEERPAAIARTFNQVGTAVFMAAATTVAGFGSLYFSSLINITHFGIFSACGVSIALFLSFTLTPAVLMLTKSGIKREVSKRRDVLSKASDKDSSNTGWPLFVVRHSGKLLVVFVAITVLSIVGTLNNHFEGDPIINFKKDNPIFKADQFLNTSLTGTNMINLVFKFRDSINLDNQETIAALRKGVTEFKDKWNGFVSTSSGIDAAPLRSLANDLQTAVEADHPDSQLITKKLNLVRDLLNEGFTVEKSEAEPVQTPAQEATSNDEFSLEDLATPVESGTDDLGGIMDLAEEASSESNNSALPGVSASQAAGLEDIATRLGLDEASRKGALQQINQIRKLKSTASGLSMQRAFNELQDFFALDVKQPVVLHKLESLYSFLKTMDHPVVHRGGKEMMPTGLVVSPVDLIRKVYKTFYHDGDLAFDRLPDTQKDGFEDITLTDRSIIAVAINQAQSSNRDMFDSVVTPDHKEFQMQIMIRSGRSKNIQDYVQAVRDEIDSLFPDNDPYIQRILIGGLAPQIREVTGLLMDSQIKSIAGSFLLVWLVTFFIFRSAMGGLFSLIPLGFTVVLNFGMMYAIGWPINQGTVIIASITIGIGVDYTIHFLERFKRQLQAGDSLDLAYLNTIRTSGKAIFINAFSVALGFMVLIFSDFIPVISMGVLMMGTMIFSTIGALVVLPVLIFIINPNFIKKRNGAENSLQA